MWVVAPRGHYRDVKRATLCRGGTFGSIAGVDPFHMGYTMGLITCEGSFTGDRRQPSLEIRSHRRDVEPLEHVQRTLGGKIFGPYTHGGRNLYVYMLRGAELKRALPIVHEFLPSSWKRVQYDLWRVKYADVLDRPQPSRALVERMERLLPSGAR